MKWKNVISKLRSGAFFCLLFIGSLFAAASRDLALEFSYVSTKTLLQNTLDALKTIGVEVSPDDVPAEIPSPYSYVYLFNTAPYAVKYTCDEGEEEKFVRVRQILAQRQPPEGLAILSPTVLTVAPFMCYEKTKRYGGVQIWPKSIQPLGLSFEVMVKSVASGNDEEDFGKFATLLGQLQSHYYDPTTQTTCAHGDLWYINIHRSAPGKFTLFDTVTFSLGHSPHEDVMYFLAGVVSCAQNISPDNAKKLFTAFYKGYLAGLCPDLRVLIQAVFAKDKQFDDIPGKASAWVSKLFHETPLGKLHKECFVSCFNDLNSK